MMENDSELEEYSNGLDLFREEFYRTYQEGIADGSIKKAEDINLFYYATTHAILELCKKLSVDVRIVRQDETIRKNEEIRALAETFLSVLKA